MLAFRSAALMASGTPIHISFSSDNLIRTLKTHDIYRYKDYELFLKLPDNKEQLMLSIENSEITYGQELHRQLIKTNGHFSDHPKLPWNTETSEVPSNLLIPTNTDRSTNHRKVKLTPEALLYG